MKHNAVSLCNPRPSVHPSARPSARMRIRPSPVRSSARMPLRPTALPFVRPSARHRKDKCGGDPCPENAKVTKIFRI